MSDQVLKSRAISLGSCDHWRAICTLIWANGLGAAPPTSAAFTVVPRCSPLDLVRLWCGREHPRQNPMSPEHADDAPIVFDLLLLFVRVRCVLVVSTPEGCSIVSFEYGDNASVMATGSLAADGV
ncbi:hypothetical protein ACFWD7_02910 [Streptomyces mirabilis]|uniref:hypothetical protein n=1 Tax=Streptomyces mirabilis TaxID=68239 RepID=UPI0021C0435D|nr:hypothetical protein [Streptomyces mirabilis]MCT9106957.1 hypothetical protein [Streptomyces mirabilis]